MADDGSAHPALGGGHRWRDEPVQQEPHFLEKWLEPTLYGNKHKLGLSGGELWILAIVAVIGRSASPQRLRSISRSASRPRGSSCPSWPGLALRRSGQRFHGRTRAKGFDLVAWFDATIVDGIVNGTGRLVRTAGGDSEPRRPVCS